MASKQFGLILSETLAGKTVLENPKCEFTYHWDFETNMGLANLISINGTQVNITLHPLGIAGSLDFMSDIPPTTYAVNASNDDSVALIEIVVYRVILDMDAKGENPKAAIMFNEDGSTIETSAGFNSENKDKLSVS